jgi:hypothetical protein
VMKRPHGRTKKFSRVSVGKYGYSWWKSMNCFGARLRTANPGVTAKLFYAA